MHVKHLAAGLVAAAALAFTGQAMAEDTIKLRLPAKPGNGLFDLKATEADLRTETIDTRRYYGGGYGGYRGGYGGYRGGFYGGRGYYGGYRGFYGGYYGGYRGYYPRYGGFYGGYRPYYYARSYGYSYFPSYYSYGGFSPGYYNYAYAYPCSGDTVAPSLTVRVGPAYSLRPSTVLPGRTPELPLPREDKDQGTFPYDGGPKAPVPMPQGEESKTSRQAKPGIVEDILVSTAPQDVSGTGKWAYPAYGETARRTGGKPQASFQLMVYGRTAK